MKGGNSPRRDGIESLVGYGVSPVNQFLKQFASPFIPRVKSVNVCPKIKTQSVEIGTDCTRVGISSIETSVPDELRSHESLEPRRDEGDNMIGALRMQVATKTLKMRRQESGIRIIDLLGRITPASLGPADHHMGVFNLVQRIGPFSVPPDQ